MLLLCAPGKAQLAGVICKCLVRSSLLSLPLHTVSLQDCPTRLQHLSTVGLRAAPKCPCPPSSWVPAMEGVERYEHKAAWGSLEPGFCPNAGRVLLCGFQGVFEPWPGSCLAQEQSPPAESC